MKLQLLQPVLSNLGLHILALTERIGDGSEAQRVLGEPRWCGMTGQKVQKSGVVLFCENLSFAVLAVLLKDLEEVSDCTVLCALHCGDRGVVSMRVLEREDVAVFVRVSVWFLPRPSPQW